MFPQSFPISSNIEPIESFDRASMVSNFSLAFAVSLTALSSIVSCVFIAGSPARATAQSTTNAMALIRAFMLRTLGALKRRGQRRWAPGLKRHNLEIQSNAGLVFVDLCV